MQHPDRSPQGWQAVLGKLIGIRGLLPAAILVTVLGVGFPFVAVQAQGGGRTSAHFALQVDTSGLTLNRVCVGEKVILPVKVVLQGIEFTGEGDVGSVTINSGQFNPTPADSSIVSAETGYFLAASPIEGPIQTQITLTGENAGTTTVTIKATIQGAVARYLTPEIGLPVPVTDEADPVTVQVTVIYCEYEVSIHSMWDTTMHGTSTLLIANAHNLRLKGDGSENTFKFEPRVDSPPYLKWTWANNRIVGCLPSSGRFDTPAPSVKAVVGKDGINVTITYLKGVPGGPSSAYYMNLCLPIYKKGEPCEERIDHICFTMKLPGGDWFTPHTLELNFPLKGDSLNKTHRITHSWAVADGWGVVTLTPVRVQQR